jgi:hypothetical protein
MKPPVAAVIIVLILTILSCQAVTVEMQAETFCQVAEGFSPAPDNVHEIYIGEELYGTIEYVNVTLSIYAEPGHVLQDSKPVLPDGIIEGSITAEHPDLETTKLVEFATCGGTLYIRETESGRSTLDA